MRTQSPAWQIGCTVLYSAFVAALSAVLSVVVGEAAERAPRHAIPDRITLDPVSLKWTAGKRLFVEPVAKEHAAEGEPAVEVTVSGPPSPTDRYSKDYSLVAHELPAVLATVDPATLVSKITCRVNPLERTNQPLLFVVRPGYGNSAPLEPAGWRTIEISNWGLAPLTVGELSEIAIRTALLPDGSRFLLGSLTLELKDAAAEAARWKPIPSDSFTVNGLWWLKENGGSLARVPQRAQSIDGLESRVWKYGQYPTGGRVRFKTDSRSLELRIDHGGDQFSWRELSLLAMAGIELYEGPPAQMVFRQISRPLSGTEPYVATFAENTDRELREYTLYLPMYAKLQSLEIAVDPHARIEPPTPYAMDKPVVFYGTSFIQGGCASRASMNLPALIGRMLAVDIVNLGFAGDGRCEPEIASLMAEIDAACFVMGPILNNLELMRENYPRFVARLRQRWPERPILLMTRLHTQGQSEPYEVNDLVRQVWKSMRAKGDRHVYFFDAFDLYRDGSVHPTVEGLHPSDLGFKIIADALAPELAKILEVD